MANRTPFLSGFGPLLFGRGSKFTLKKVQAIRSLESLFEMFGDFVPARFLCKETKGVNSRERELPPRIIFWAFVNQVLDPGSSCREILRKVEAWWKARKGQAFYTLLGAGHLVMSRSVRIEWPAGIPSTKRSSWCCWKIYQLL